MATQLSYFAEAFAGIVGGSTLLIVALAVLLGLVVGAIPGLTGTLALALLINLTYGMETSTAVAFLLGVYVGAVSGGLFSAIMLNIPGTPNAAATALDGFPLAKQGKGGKALFGGVFASFLGTLISTTIMMLLTPVIYLVALKFGKWELFLLAFFGITICGNLSVDSTPLKGWIVGFLGFFFAMVGRDALYNVPRFVLLKDLNSGVTLVPALIGLFGIAEVLCVLMDKTPYKINDSMGSIIPNKSEAKDLLKPVIRSGLIGCGIGAIPGAGEDIAAWLSYSVGKSRSKNSEKFMHGSFEGLSCSETANNACIAGAMIPMLTLAIPGSSQAAMFLAAMNLHGVKPGPMLSIQDPTFMYQVGIVLIIAAFTMVILALFLTKPMVMILKINRKILMPIIVPLTMIGAYATNGKVFDVWIALFFGIVGFILRKCKFSMAPLVLGLILGSSADTNFRQAMTQGHIGSLMIRPAGIILLIVVIYSLVSGIMKTLKTTKAMTAGAGEAETEADAVEATVTVEDAKTEAVASADAITETAASADITVESAVKKE